MTSVVPLNRFRTKIPLALTPANCQEGTIGEGKFLNRAARLWAEGNDSRAIASILSVHESEIYNRIGEIKARAAVLCGGLR